MVGVRIKEIREDLGISMAQFARLIEATPGAVNNWEKDVREPSIDTLIKIANIGGKTLDWLLLGNETKETKSSVIITELREKLNVIQKENKELKKYLNNFVNTAKVAEGKIKYKSEED